MRKRIVQSFFSIKCHGFDSRGPFLLLFGQKSQEHCQTVCGTQRNIVKWILRQQQVFYDCQTRVKESLP